MNRKLIITIALAVIGIVLVVLGVFLIIDSLSWKNVNFKLSPTTKAISIRDRSFIQSVEAEAIDNESYITTLTGSGSLRLKTGTYYITPEGDDVSNEEIVVEIKNETTEIDINPFYSDSYLARTNSSEVSIINDVIKQGISKKIEDAKIGNGQFYHFGDWYSTTLHDNSMDALSRNGYDMYGVILQKQKGVWVIVAQPKLLYKYADYSNIPKDIIDLANQMVAFPTYE